ncbi:MAG: hypothetical protein II602_00875, partial [Erysipelotrichales bacterium]|nr:hypothetical protein [Erysipelotrichales bacterium]
MNHLKKLLVVLVAAMMVINSLSLSVFAYKEGTTPKFQASISSTTSDGQTTTVEGTVYDDYGMELVLPNTKVNASNAEVKIKLTNVASLGGIDREASMRLTTGSTAELFVYDIMKRIAGEEEALFAFQDANVHAVVKTAEESKEVSYQFAGSDFDNEANSVKTVTGTADTEAARAAWMLLVEQIETGTTDDEDSYIIIANGSTLQIGKEVLSFEADKTDDLKLDNFTDLDAMSANIRNYLKLDSSRVSKLSATLKKGTKLKVGQSYATLLKDAVITLEGVGDVSDLHVLSELRDQNDKKAIALGLLTCMNKAIGLADKAENVNAILDFSEKEPELEEDVKFRIKVSSKASDGSIGSVTGSVYSDYNGDIVVNGTIVSRSNMTVDVWMQNVLSLGVEGIRHYSRTVYPVENGADANLVNAMNALFNPLKDKDTKIIGKVGDLSATYTITYDGNIVKANTTENDARAVFQELVKNVTTETLTDEDSYIELANGSYLVSGNQKLEFENKNGEALRIDNITSWGDLEQEIRDAVTLTELDEAYDHFEAYLEPGTIIRLGQSLAKLNAEVRIAANIGDLSEALIALRDAATKEDMLGAIMQGILKGIEEIAGKPTTVEFEVGHIYDENSEVTYSWSEDLSTCTATAKCSNNPAHEATETETVNTTSDVTVKPTAIKEGVATYTAVFENELFETQTKTAPIPVTDYKFVLQVSSKNGETNNAVTATVYKDYSTTLVVDEGLVNRSNITVGVWMKDVLSLGVEGVRHHEVTLNTGLEPQESSLDTLLNFVNSFEGATVIGKAEGKEVTYTIVKEGRTFTGTPNTEEAARGVWQAIVNEENLESKTQEANDSKLVIKAGSYLQAGAKKLYFHDDLTIDGVSNLSALEEAVRSAADLLDAEEVEEGLVLYAEPETLLAVGESVVTLKRDAKITITGEAIKGEELAEELVTLQANASLGELLQFAVGLVNKANGTTTTVEFEFDHKYGEP